MSGCQSCDLRSLFVAGRSECRFQCGGRRRDAPPLLRDRAGVEGAGAMPLLIDRAVPRTLSNREPHLFDIEGGKLSVAAADVVVEKAPAAGHLNLQFGEETPSEAHVIAIEEGTQRDDGAIADRIV